MKLTAEQIQANWIEFNTNIETFITGDRKQRLLDFYSKYEGPYYINASGP